jgi:GPH family glycoside/pentoside/hexuronide:cation symporter
MQTTPTAKLTTRVKLAYGSGDLGFALTDAMLGVLFAIFLTDVVGLAPLVAAAAIFIGRSSDYINDPIVGYITDRTRSRWGRRRPYLLFGAIPFAIGFSMLWWQPPLTGQIALAIYYGLAYVFYDLAASFVYMPYYALTPELSDDYDERTSLTSYRMLYSIVGSMIAFIVPLAIIGVMAPENSSTILVVGVAMGVISAAPFLLVFFNTHERAEFQHLKPPGIKESLAAAFRNKPFLFSLGIFLFSFGALEIMQSMLLYFLRYRMNLEEQSDLIAGCLFGAALLSLPFWNWLSGRWDKRVAYMSGMLFLGLVMTTIIFIPPGWGLAPILVIAALAGVGFGAVQVLPWSMLPDAIEWDELKTGSRHEGMFYSLVTLFRKMASSLTIPLTLLVLGWTGYVANSPDQPAAAMTGIRVMMGPVPAALLLVGVVFAWFYPLDRKHFEALRAELAQKRIQATPAQEGEG